MFKKGMIVVKGRDVLVIDDMEESQFLIGEHLKNINLSYYSVYSIEEARKFLETQKCRLILLDLIFPKENGLVFLNEIRKNDNFDGVPIVVISSMKDSKVIVKAMEIGAEDYLTKPIDRDILSDKIATLLKEQGKISLPVMQISPGAKFAPITFDIQVRIRQISEEEVIFLSNVMFLKDYFCNLELPDLAELNVRTLNLRVKSVRVLEQQDYTYEILAHFSELDIETQMALRKWLLSS